MSRSYSLELAQLSAAYEARQLTPRAVVRNVIAAIGETREKNPVWIDVLPLEALLRRAAELEERRAQGERPPLYGAPFAVKDNIDVAGCPTTAACPAFSYVPRETAHAVERLEQAGAICVGKTNMDQFATGLVGTRSPYGACVNPFDERYIAGGSSSGSAVAVALGHVSFALGTDTAGSGRVPAGFCNLVGLKPTRGLISMHGVVAACRSLDCMSIFSLSAEDAASVFDVLAAPDAADPYSRQETPQCSAEGTRPLQCGVLREADLQFFGDEAARRAYERAVDAMARLGAEMVEIDYTPFLETARMLYDGPWVAERLAAIRSFYESSADAMHPVVRNIIGGGAKFSAADAFEAHYRLQALRKACSAQWESLDMLVVPTTGTIYRIDEVLADPVRLNSNLGYYTNFVNLLDLCAIALPAGFRDDGLPCGITFIGRALDDAKLLQRASRYAAALSPRRFR
ncbi:MAG: allophanate hydrolase [Burkholderiales bacterium]